MKELIMLFVLGVLRAGKYGGEIISEGKPSDLKKNSYTKPRLYPQERKIEVQTRRKGNGKNHLTRLQRKY